MRCNKAEEELNKYKWDYDIYSHDNELMDHLKKCHKCRAMLIAEDTLRNSLKTVRDDIRVKIMTFETFREKIQNAGAKSELKSRYHKILSQRAKARLGFAAGLALILIAILTLVPFDYNETVGYEVAIAGVDKNIALNFQEITPLLQALGMEPDKISSLLDSIGNNEIHLTVGDCEETCQLKITDLRTEQDARLVIKAIIELGCCEIEKLIPIFKSRSTTIFKHATKNLFS